MNLDQELEDLTLFSLLRLRSGEEDALPTGRPKGLWWPGLAVTSAGSFRKVSVCLRPLFLFVFLNIFQVFT